MCHVPLALYGSSDELMKIGMGRRGVKFQEEEREWILPGLLYADDLVLCGESEEFLRAMARRFFRCVEEV